MMQECAFAAEAVFEWIFNSKPLSERAGQGFFCLCPSGKGWFRILFETTEHGEQRLTKNESLATGCYRNATFGSRGNTAGNSFLLVVHARNALAADVSRPGK